MHRDQLVGIYCGTRLTVVHDYRKITVKLQHYSVVPMATIISLTDFFSWQLLVSYAAQIIAVKLVNQ